MSHMLACEGPNVSCTNPSSDQTLHDDFKICFYWESKRPEQVNIYSKRPQKRNIKMKAKT